MKKLKDLYQANDQILNDAFDRIVAEIHLKKQQKGKKIFLLCGCEPGVGTTTISISVAIAMANAGWKTLIVDADFRKISEAKRLNSSAELGLTDYLTGKVNELEEVICNTNYSQLHYLGSGKNNKNAISMLCSVTMKELLAQLREEYDYIIMDVPSIATAIDASVLAVEADSVVLVTAQHLGTKRMVLEAKKQMERVSAEVDGIIVNRIEEKEYRRAIKNYDYFKKRRYINKKYIQKEKRK